MLLQQESSCAICTMAQGVERKSLTFPDDVDYSANHTGPYDQGDPMVELILVRYHKNTTSSSYLTISLTCMCRITDPSGLVRFLPSPTRFNGWSTKSTSSRTGNPYCHTKAGVIVFTRLPLSTKAWTFLPSTIKSTSNGSSHDQRWVPALSCHMDTHFRSLV